MNKKDYILIIAQQEIEEFVCEIADRYNANVIIASGPVDGLMKYNQYMPCLVIVDGDMQMLNGFSLGSIIKESISKSGAKSSDCAIYLIVNKASIVDAKVDYYIRRPIRPDLLVRKISDYFRNRRMVEQHKKDIVREKEKLQEFLPSVIATKRYRVDYIYSPYDELSGDYLDFWYGEDQKGLYGFLFDCTGHGISSFLQVYETRKVFRNGFRLYRKDGSLSDIVKNVNEELFCLHGDDTSCVAAMVFFCDFEKNVFKYCPAGMISFFVQLDGEDGYQEVPLKNPLIGYENESNFKEYELPLLNVNEIILSSDGFSELLYKDPCKMETAKHDDVSAIFIKLKCEG